MRATKLEWAATMVMSGWRLMVTLTEAVSTAHGLLLPGEPLRLRCRRMLPSTGGRACDFAARKLAGLDVGARASHARARSAMGAGPPAPATCYTE